MKCPNCQYENRDDAKFCKSCGFKLAGLNDRPAPKPAPAGAAPVCPACGATVKPGAKFCAKCGSSIDTFSHSVPDMETVTPLNATTGMQIPPYSGDATLTDMNSTGGSLFADSTTGGSLFTDSTMGGSLFANTAAGNMPPYNSGNNTVFDSTMGGATLYSEATVYNNPPVQDPVPIPPAPAPEVMHPAGSPAFCKQCGAPLKPGAKFCSKCGTVTGTPEPTVTPVTPTTPDNTGRKAPVKPKDTSSEKPQKSDKKKKNPAIIVLIILIVALLLGGGFFALIKTGIINLGSSSDAVVEDSDTEENEEETDENTEDAETQEEPEEDLAGLEEKLAPLSEQVTAAEDKLNNEDYVGASSDLTEVLTAYAGLASEYDSQSAVDMISPLADNAFSLYTTATLKIVEGLENQHALAAIYQQIGITLGEASDLATKLKESNLTISTDKLDENYEAYPARYKEKYILTFNDLRTGSEWSRTTAWQYMQDAASVGLVDKENKDDPLTLRYSYALAWITQRDLSEGMNDGSVTTESAISSILSLAESIDYNPVLMRDLALYYDASGNSASSKIMQTACTDVYNYLLNNENVYLNGKDLFVPGRGNSNASSTIALNDFWYFNDFGEYAPSTTNGVSPEGRKFIRDTFKKAVDSL